MAATPANGGINLYWNPVTGAEKYHICYGFSVDSVTIDGGETTGEFLSIGELARDTMYYFRVRSYNSAGWSDWSVAANAKTADVTSIPPPAAAPTNVTAVALSPTEVLVSWTAVAEADKYRVFYYTGGTEISLNTEYSPVRISDLSPNTVYTFTVKAGNSGGWSAAFAQASAATLRVYTVTTGTLSHGAITANPASGAEGTPITITAAPNSGYQLKEGTLRYYVGGAGYNITGTNFTLPASDVTVRADFELSVPSGVTAAATSSSSITVSWSAVAGVSGYKVYRSGSGGGSILKQYYCQMVCRGRGGRL
jgi:hypothetical protein